MKAYIANGQTLEEVMDVCVDPVWLDRDFIDFHAKSIKPEREKTISARVIDIYNQNTIPVHTKALLFESREQRDSIAD